MIVIGQDFPRSFPADGPGELPVAQCAWNSLPGLSRILVGGTGGR